MSSSNSSQASLPPPEREPTASVLKRHRQTIAELLSLQDVLFQSSLLPPDLIARLSVLACRLWREGDSLEAAAAADTEALVLKTAEHTAAAAAAADLEEAARVAAMQPAPPPPPPKEQPFRRGSRGSTAMPVFASTVAAASAADSPRQRPTRGGVVSQPTAPPPPPVPVKRAKEDEASLKRLRTAIVVERWKRVQEGMARAAQQELHDTEAEALRGHIKLVTAMYQKLWDDTGGDTNKAPRSRPTSAARSRPTRRARSFAVAGPSRRTHGRAAGGRRTALR